MEKRCAYCGQKIPTEVKVKGYHWEQKKGYNFGHWVKDKKKIIVTSGVTTEVASEEKSC